MLRLPLDRLRSIFLSLVLAGLLLWVLSFIVAAQEAPTITITAGSDEVKPGEVMKFKVSYTLPPGSDNARGVIAATWSANAIFDSASAGYDTELIQSRRELQWNYPDALPLSNELPFFTLRANEGLDAVVATATLTITGSDQPQQVVSEPARIPVVSAEGKQVDPQAGVADLSKSTLAIGPTKTAIAGAPITITVLISNTGSAPAEDVSVTLTPSLLLQDIVALQPPDLIESPIVPVETVSFTLPGRVPAQQKQEIVLEATVPNDAVGELTITGEIAASGGIRQSLPETAIDLSPANRPKLSVEIDSPPKTILAGQPFSFTLKLSSTGPPPADPVQIAVTTNPPVQLKVSPREGVDQQAEADRLILSVAELPSDVLQIESSGPLPNVGGLEVIIEVLNAEQYDPSSQFENSRRIVVQPEPTATPVPTSTTEAALPTVVPTPAATTPGEDGSLSVPLLILAFLTALAAGIMLLFLLRGRRKPRAPLPPAPGPSPASPGPVLVTAPLPTSSASLEVVAQPGVRIGLKPDVTTIGRAPDSVIRIDERTMNWETVSRTHAEIRREGGNYVIYDVCPDRRSSNGVFVEGRRTVRNVLRPGWRIGIGAVEFIFRDTAAEEQ